MDARTGGAGEAAGGTVVAADAAAVRAGVRRLRGGPHDARGVPPLRRAPGGVGRRDRHGLAGSRPDLRGPREPRARSGRTGRAHRRRARLAGQMLRLDGPAGARRPRQAAAGHAGGPDRVPPPVAEGPAAVERDGGGRAPLPRCRARSGPYDGRAPGKAPAVRVVGLPRGVGGGAGPPRAEPPAGAASGPDDPSAGGERVPGVAGEPGVSRLAGDGHPRGDERGRAVRVDARGSGAPGADAGRAGRHRAGRRPVAAFPAGREPGGGRGRGRAEGRAEGQAEGLAKAVREILRARGVACPEDPCAGIPDGVPADAVVAAALACDGVEDFRARLRARAGR